MRELRFLEISDLGDNLEEQERSLSFDARQTWIQIQTSWIMLNYQHGLFFFFWNLSTFVSSSGKLRTMTTPICCCCCCSVTKSCLTLCDFMDCKSPGFSVLHNLPEFAQIHVHWACDAIQPSCPLLSPFPPAFNLSQHQGLFQWVDSAPGGQSRASVIAPTPQGYSED